MAKHLNPLEKEFLIRKFKGNWYEEALFMGQTFGGFGTS